MTCLHLSEQEHILKRKLKRQANLLRLYDGVHYFTCTQKLKFLLKGERFRLEGGQHV